MATFKAVIRPKKNKKGESPIYIRISDTNKDRYISLRVHIKPTYWNKTKGKVRQNDYYDADKINELIDSKLSEVRKQYYQLLSDEKPVNADRIKKSITNINAGNFLEYAKLFAKRKHQRNKRTGDKYDSIISKINEYTDGNLPFNYLTVSWLKEYEDWLVEEKGNSQNTIHSNLRAIRAILYDAIREGLYDQAKNPFFLLKLNSPKVSRVKLTEKEINAFSKLKLKPGSIKELARDAYLFSFYTCGMRFTDVCLIKPINIVDDEISYLMSKTHKQHSVRFLPQAKEIKDYYMSGNKQRYIFPLLNPMRNLDDESILDNAISSMNASVNKALKKLAAEADIYKKISFHTARHSYADIARKRGMSIYDISKSLGHSSLKVTEQYLLELDSNATGKAVERYFRDI